MTSIPSAPIVDAIMAKLAADLPASYQVFDAQGPSVPEDDVPYLVVYADTGSPEGEPMVIDKSLVMQFSVRAVGVSAAQSRHGGDRVKASLHGATFTVGGRQVYTYQEFANSVLRDDAAGPPALFEHLVLFGLRADP